MRRTRSVFLLIALAVALSCAAVAAAATITGTPGDDTLFGTASDDTIDALAGNDTVVALAGDDRVDGGPGKDDIWGDGSCRKLGSPYYCIPRGQHCPKSRKHKKKKPYYCIPSHRRFGNDKLYGGSERDVIRGNRGDDHIAGGPGHDILLGGGDDDWIYSRDGERDYVNCGRGWDRVKADRKDKVSRDCEFVIRRRVEVDREGQ
jgi:Ca2+-binding RTX toxin-like protein